MLYVELPFFAEEFKTMVAGRNSAVSAGRPAQNERQVSSRLRTLAFGSHDGKKGRADILKMLPNLGVRPKGETSR